MPPADGLPATKADINAVRTDLKGDIKRLAIEVVKFHARIDKLEETLRGEMHSNTNRIINHIDAFAKKAENYARAAVLHGHVLTEAQITLKDHEKRIVTLESKA